ncbi:MULTISPECIES: YafY family protein [Brevibacillus]|uniref:helix-turn-helix transcriptional regulator n=1 Tax=Brevibacillus TaxID=55080 RepID=UPI001C22F4AD|nr:MULTISPECIES: YafY family protein [Brevibacillus]MBU8714195.1 YafY family transcriptional regulator [Brevibacillus parabrevis]MDH6350349.1 putative DNA-binding transcriptional regulator YafY [Brevibacillus sp. 1238]
MRADRLLSILLHLQNCGRMTTRQLAEKLEVSERTIHRDMEALSASGVPVYAERGSAGGWVLAEGYRTSLTGLKIDELQSLMLSSPSRVLNDLGLAEGYERAFWKLLSALPQPVQQDAWQVRERLHIDGAGWHESDETFPLLATIQDAVWLSRKLWVRYQREDALVERTLLPLGLVAKRSTWYLVAQIDADLRTYRISRFTEARVLEEAFVRPENFDLASYWEESTTQFKASLPRYPAVIRFREEAWPRLKQERYMKIASTHAAKSGWIEAEVEFHTLDSACALVLGYASLIEVREPAELRAEVISRARSILHLYENATRSTPDAAQ